jgi:hypothetical protein
MRCSFHSDVFHQRPAEIPEAIARAFGEVGPHTRRHCCGRRRYLDRP